MQQLNQSKWGGPRLDSCEDSQLKPDSHITLLKDDDHGLSLVANRYTSCGRAPPVAPGMHLLVDHGGWGSDRS